MRIPVLAALLLAAAAPLGAAEVGECDAEVAHIRHLAEPWADNTRTFANGQVRVAVLATAPPGITHAHRLAVLLAPQEEFGEGTCRMVSAAPGRGFDYLTLDTLHADYDPAVGLTLELAPRVWIDREGGGFFPVPLTVVVDQRTGEVIAR